MSPNTATIAAPCDNGDIVLFDLSGSIVASMIRSATVRTLNSNEGLMRPQCTHVVCTYLVANYLQTHVKTVVATAWTADEAHLVSAGYPEDIFGWAPTKSTPAVP